MKKSKILYALVAVVFVALLVVAGVFYDDLSQQYAQAPAVPQQPGNSQTVTAPDFTVEDMDGNPVSLSDFVGTPVVLNFWASWCGPCKNEMPDFNTAWSEYGDRVQFLMVNLTDNTQETLESAKAFLATANYGFPVFFDTKLEGAIAYGVTGIPATYFINAEGEVVARAASMLSHDALLSGIQMILED